MFGSNVAQIVVDCTDSWVEPKPAWRPRKEACLYMRRLRRIVDAILRERAR
jgi:hypothetical protein